VALVSVNDVRTYLSRPDITEGQVAVAGRLVAGWLREDSGGNITVPLPADDPLWAAAFELVVLAVTNPASIAARSAGPTSTTWPITVQRDAIRQGVRDRAQRAATGPTGSFPPAPPYPDPALPAGYLTVREVARW
jgi:hypothetical protein